MVIKKTGTREREHRPMSIRVTVRVHDCILNDLPLDLHQNKVCLYPRAFC